MHWFLLVRGASNAFLLSGKPTSCWCCMITENRDICYFACKFRKQISTYTKYPSFPNSTDSIRICLKSNIFCATNLVEKVWIVLSNCSYFFVLSDFLNVVPVSLTWMRNWNYMKTPSKRLTQKCRRASIPLLHLIFYLLIYQVALPYSWNSQVLNTKWTQSVCFIDVKLLFFLYLPWKDRKE